MSRAAIHWHLKSPETGVLPADYIWFETESSRVPFENSYLEMGASSVIQRMRFAITGGDTHPVSPHPQPPGPPPATWTQPPGSLTRFRATLGTFLALAHQSPPEPQLTVHASTHNQPLYQGGGEKSLHAQPSSGQLHVEVGRVRWSSEGNWCTTARKGPQCDGRL